MGLVENFMQGVTRHDLFHKVDYCVDFTIEGKSRSRETG